MTCTLSWNHLCDKSASSEPSATSPSLSTLLSLLSVLTLLSLLSVLAIGVLTIRSSGVVVTTVILGGSGGVIVTTVILGGSGGVIVTTVVVVVSTSSCGSDNKLRAVIRRTTLCNGHENKLMVGRGSHSADAVVASRKSSGNSCREPTVAITSIVDSLEEGKLSSIERSGGVQGVAEILDSDVGVAEDLATLELLWRGVVGGISVGEGSGYEVCHLDFDIESGVGLNVGTALRRERDYGRDHVGFGGDISHDCLVLGNLIRFNLFGNIRTNSIAGTSLDLKTIRQRLSRAEVYEVVIRSNRHSLAGCDIG